MIQGDNTCEGFKLSSLLRSYKLQEIYTIKWLIKLCDISRNAFIIIFLNLRLRIEELIFWFKTSKRWAECTFNMRIMFNEGFWNIFFLPLPKEKSQCLKLVPAAKASNLSTPQHWRPVYFSWFVSQSRLGISLAVMKALKKAKCRRCANFLL